MNFEGIWGIMLEIFLYLELLQRVLEKPLEKKAGRNYAPPGTKKLIYFIDDINMPMVCEYFVFLCQIFILYMPKFACLCLLG